MIKYFTESIIQELEFQIEEANWQTDLDVLDWADEIERNYGELLTLKDFIHLTDLAFDKLDNTY